jgi:hypothetical protein
MYQCCDWVRGWTQITSGLRLPEIRDTYLPKGQGRIWESISSQNNLPQEHFAGVMRARREAICKLHLVSTWRMRAAVNPLQHSSSWLIISAQDHILEEVSKWPWQRIRAAIAGWFARWFASRTCNLKVSAISNVLNFFYIFVVIRKVFSPANWT